MPPPIPPIRPIPPLIGLLLVSTFLRSPPIGLPTLRAMVARLRALLEGLWSNLQPLVVHPAPNLQGLLILGWSNLQTSFLVQRAPNLQGFPLPLAGGLASTLATFSPFFPFFPSFLAFFSLTGLGTGGWPNLHFSLVQFSAFLHGLPLPFSLSSAAFILVPIVSVS